MNTQPHAEATWIAWTRQFLRRHWMPLAAVVVAVMVALGLGLPVRHVSHETDNVTGSGRRRTTVLWVITTDEQVELSPFATLLRQRGIDWVPAWHWDHGTNYDVYGRWTSVYCGGAPPVVGMGAALEKFASLSSDDELRAFVHVMKAGTLPEQHAMVDSSAKKVLAAWDQSTPGG